MPSNWENIKNTVKDEFSEAVTSTKKYYKIGKGKLDIRKINDSLNDSFSELGNKVYNCIDEDKKEDIRHNPEVKSLIEKINQLKQLIKEEELEIEVMKKGSVPQTKAEEATDNPPDVGPGKRVSAT